MAFVLKDRVGEQVATEGTGALTLSGVAMGGYQSIASVMSDGDTSLFCVKDRTDAWNTFLGTYTAATRSLARTVVLDGSSGPGVAASLTGAAQVWMTQTASRDSRVLNVRDFGAKGDGTTDDTAAIQRAFAAVPEGGEVLIPEGTYSFRGNLFVKAGTTVSGRGVLKAATIGLWPGSPYYGLVNVNHEASTITDTDITVRGITIDYTDLPSADGTRHCIYIRKARRVVVENVAILGGSSAIALLGCDDTQEIGNRLVGFSNCGSDHWDGPSNGRLIGCHIETDESAQMVNWNPDPTIAPSTGYTADGFVMTGNTLISHEANATPIQLEPLRADATARNITVTGNTFVNCWLVLRGDTTGAVVAENIMSGFQGTAEAITGYTRNGGTPSAIIIAKNIVRDPLTSADSVGVIRMESDTASIFANIIMGSGYASAGFYRGAAAAQIFGNYAAALSSTGWLKNGFYVEGGSANLIGWTDSAGTHPCMYQQTNDDNWIFQMTDSTGAPRVALTMYARSDTSDLIAAVPMLFNSPFRKAVVTAAAAGTNIATATALTANTTNVTSCTAGVADGVQLSATTGRPQTVINSTADTLKVYPNNSGSSQIDAGGASVAATIAAGKSKTFEMVATGDFRTTAAT